MVKQQVDMCTNKQDEQIGRGTYNMDEQMNGLKDRQTDGQTTTLYKLLILQNVPLRNNVIADVATR
jgi:hypothetical protein